MPIRHAYAIAAFIISLAATAFGQPVDGATLAPRPAIAAPSILEFQGPIDGSERIEITPSSATWHNIDRHLPLAPMTINGQAWDPRQHPTLDNGGDTKFLDSSVDFAHARLEVIAARDTVAMTKTDDGIMLYLNDTPNGAAQYHFRIVFTPPAPESLRIKARIDGSDILHITQNGATWEHKHWAAPAAVTINGRDWNPNKQPTLPNAGETIFLRHPVDFTTAHLIHKNGRDMAVVMPAEDGLKIHFADNPNGADDYELIIAFGE